MGVVQVAGPTYETRAEGRFIRSAGADVVGMSYVQIFNPHECDWNTGIQLTSLSEGGDSTARCLR